MIIAVDGPAGSGKSTISKLLAKELGLVYLDTGAMYRLFTLKMLKENVSFSDSDKINELLGNLNINIENGKFYLDDEDVSEDIRKTDVAENVSKTAAIDEVREKMVSLQREFSKSKNVILDGRDIGTVVFPEADIKIFLVADPRERAERRFKELKAKGENISLDSIYENILKRDKLDSTRENSPLKKANDAIEVDTTGKNIEEVKNIILNLYINKDKKNNENLMIWKLCKKRHM